MKYNSKLSVYKLKKIIKCFCIDIDTTRITLLLVLNHNTINHWFAIFRQEIYEYQSSQKSLSHGEIKLNESYFG